MAVDTAAAQAAAAWNPSTADEKKVKQALEKLNTSNREVVIPGKDGASQKFVINSKAYFDLQAFIITGSKFPKTTGEFEKKMPKASFTKLTDIDSKIYDKTEETMVSIGATCNKYYDEQLSKLVTAGAIAITYSRKCLEFLTEADGVNLQAQLKVILDPKYNKKAAFDDDFYAAQETAGAALRTLEREAEDNKKEVTKIVEELRTLKTKTSQLLGDVRFLETQYKTGPAKNESGKTQPYLEFLNTELARHVKEITQAAKDAELTEKEWDQETVKALRYAIPLWWFWIPMGIHADKAIKLKKKLDELRVKIQKLKQEKLEETTLIEHVNALITQCTDIDDKMGVALEAMTTLGKHFDVHRECYHDIAGYLNNMEVSGLTMGAMLSRKSCFNYNIDACVKSLHELRKVASTFVETVDNQTSAARKAE
ncbi:hypothetical protein BJ508DRAFT_418966 [Ascobolus immersus RN42]|uniref:Uncharacterized protein n=1 Tax=Ascobolus immersus RN42 TaxID=1160509 RepID=A0A3N4HI22_ASCIM|nr:hypothetical protein BJ508DRAFT_418966 [Ascobolus immersus RN42]